MYRFKKPGTGKYTEVSIGPWPEYGYSSARQVADDLYVKVLQGKDPVVEARKQEASKTTFAEACEGFIAQHRSKWRSLRHIRILLKHCEPLAEIPVPMIDKTMVRDTFTDLYKHRPVHALRALRLCKRILDYAIANDMRPGPNPAQWRDHLEHNFPERPKNNEKHYPSLPFQDVPELMSRLNLREIRGTSAAALRFQILTAARLGEVRNMKWTQVENRIWTLPPECTKQNRQHRVPLSAMCLEILDLQNEYRKTDYVFPGRDGPLDAASVRQLLKRMDLPKHVTPHGFRASFRNWAARARINGERIDYRLAEMCLGHLVKGKVEEAYWTEDALEERREIMQAWASYCSG
jgi:integrase